MPQVSTRHAWVVPDAPYPPRLCLVIQVSPTLVADTAPNSSTSQTSQLYGSFVRAVSELIGFAPLIQRPTPTHLKQVVQLYNAE